MIQAAELPLNERGAVYHLDLLPDELANVIITVGDPARVAQISRYFDRIEVKRAHREFVTHTGFIGQQRLSVISTGIGVPNIDIVMNELDALVNIDLVTRSPYRKTKSLTIIRLGTTGSLQPDCMPGDIVISRFAIGFDTLLYYYQNTPSFVLTEMHEALQAHLAGQAGPFYVAEADPTLLGYFSSIGTVGITATCGGFYGPQARQLRLPLQYPHLLEKLTQFHFEHLKVTNFEMETAGILGMGQLLGHRCLSLSVVLANRINGVFISDVKLAVEELINSALQVMSSIPKKPENAMF